MGQPVRHSEQTCDGPDIPDVVIAKAMVSENFVVGLV